MASRGRQPTDHSIVFATLSERGSVLTICFASGHVALVDCSDWTAVRTVGFSDGFHWTGRPCDVTWTICQDKHTDYLARGFYASDGKYRKLLLHRLILSCDARSQVDHINHNGLDNRRSNIRICTLCQNSLNQRPRGVGPYKGVTFYGRKFYAKITNNGITKHIGAFHSLNEAASAWNDAAREIHGKFAYQNFICPELDVVSIILPKRTALRANSNDQANSPKRLRNGFSWNRSKRRWVAVIWHNKRRLHVGHFLQPEDARRAVALKRMELANLSV